jgi:hypothetical protein
MFNISTKTGRRIVKVGFWAGFAYQGWQELFVCYDPIGIFRPYLVGAVVAFCVAGVLALAKRY